MKRDYADGVKENVTLFTGIEIERTPAYGMKTLFVVGTMNPQVIVNTAVSNNCKHIYFGANQSFPRLDTNDSEGWRGWEDMIEFCLDSDLWCTLDLEPGQVEGLLESSLTEYRRFIPQISVKLPYLKQLGYNTTIKIDDKDFEATNPGVWCIPIGALTQRKYFTNWDDYGNDETIV
jgi:hypothetical protein